MGTVLAVLGVLAVLLVAGFVATREGEVLVDAPRDHPDLDLPELGPVRAEDLAGVRLGMALRGYRMAEVDALLDRLAEELRERDAVIEELTAGPTATGPQIDPPEPDGEPEEPALPPVHERPGAAPPRPVPFPEPVHVDEPEQLPGAPDAHASEPEDSDPPYARRT